MPYTPFIPNTEQWTDFFLHQVQKKRNGSDSTKKNAADGPIGGGITMQDESVRLTPVGHAQSSVKGPQPEKAVTVKITSPVDSALDQAADELKHIKANKDLADVIRNLGGVTKASQRKRPAKKKPSKKGHSSSKSSASKGGKTKRSKDVFSK